VIHIHYSLLMQTACLQQTNNKVSDIFYVSCQQSKESRREISRASCKLLVKAALAAQLEPQLKGLAESN
jgi:hypothetical protein